MLSKVMKYELRASGRQLLPFFGLALVGAALIRLLYWLAGVVWPVSLNILRPLLFMVTVLAAGAVLLLAFVSVLARFYQSTVGSEAYLTFTLPVKAGTHIWGRAWVGLLYTTLGCVAAFAVLLIATPGMGSALLTELGQAKFYMGEAGASRYIQLSGGQIGIVLGIVAAAIVAGLLITLFQIYASMALGTVISKNRVAGGILGYIVLNTVESVLSVPLVLVPVALTIGFTEEKWTTFFGRWMTGTDAEILSSFFGFMLFIVGLSLAVGALFTAIHYVITKRFFTTKLNLE